MATHWGRRWSYLTPYMMKGTSVGLYLCIFDGDDEVDGDEVGPYSDFGGLRDYVVRELEGGRAGSQFPTFILHSDCDGEWSVTECVRLRTELAQIRSAMQARPPVPFVSDLQRNVAQSFGLVPKKRLRLIHRCQRRLRS